MLLNHSTTLQLSIGAIARVYRKAFYN